MACEFALRQAVAFHETDMAGLVHFSNFFRWMEMAEHAFLQSLELPAVLREGDVFWGWPRARARCDYHGPLAYGDAFECRLFVKEIKIKSVVYFFRFRKLVDGRPGEAVARGELASVYARFGIRDGSVASAAMPEAFLGAIEAASPEAIAESRRD